MNREFLEEFTSAKWKNGEEIRAFIGKAVDITADDLLAMLDILTGKKIVPDSLEQERRTKVFYELAGNLADKRLFDTYLKAIKTGDKSVRSMLVPLIVKIASTEYHPRICDLLKSPDSSLRRTACHILLKLRNQKVLKYIDEMFADCNFAGRKEAIDLAGAMPCFQAVELFKTVIASGKPAEKIMVLNHIVNPNFLHRNGHGLTLVRPILLEIDEFFVADAIAASVIEPALHDDDELVRSEAIVAYTKVCNEEQFFDHLGQYLYHNNSKLVITLLEGLRRFDSERTIAVLERKLYTGPNAIRLTVLDSIEHIGKSCIYKILLRALEHKNDLVRKRAGEVLSRLTRDGKIRISDSIFWLLRSKDHHVRQMAVAVAATHPGQMGELWPEILQLLVKEDWWVRQSLVDTLAEIGGEELTPHVIRYLDDPSDVIRRFSLDVLLKLKSRSSSDDVVKTALHDNDWWVREKAIEVLAEIKDERAVPAILKICVSEPDFRVPAIKALSKLGARPAAKQIAPFITAEDSDVRLAVLHYLEAVGDREFDESILSCMEDPVLPVRRAAQQIAKVWNISGGSTKAYRDEPLSLIDRLLIGTCKAGGDDLILLPGNAPYIKKHGKIVVLAKNTLNEQHVLSMIMPILSPQQKENLRSQQDIDFSYEVRSEGIRFRANVFMSRTGMSAVFRIIKGDICRLEDLGLPPIVKSFGDFKNGLILVGGPTGSGKSTTLSTIIAYINRTSRRHVISIEDPIEAVHKSEMGLINQREVGIHTPSFGHALRMTLREDPDVILVGEMRDLQTIQFAVTAAETGHLVLGTVHTVSADSSVDRLINAYPPESQEQVRSMLADSLRAVLCQYLIRSKDGNGRVLASEVMLNNGAIANLIRKGKTFQIPSVIMTSRDQQMQVMDASLMELCQQGKITAEEAYLKARNKRDFEELLGTAVITGNSSQFVQDAGKEEIHGQDRLVA